MLFLAMGVLIFSSLCYFAEKVKAKLDVGWLREAFTWWIYLIKFWTCIKEFQTFAVGQRAEEALNQSDPIQSNPIPIPIPIHRGGGFITFFKYGFPKWSLCKGHSWYLGEAVMRTRKYLHQISHTGRGRYGLHLHPGLLLVGDHHHDHSGLWRHVPYHRSLLFYNFEFELCSHLSCRRHYLLSRAMMT